MASQGGLAFTRGAATNTITRRVSARGSVYLAMLLTCLCSPMATAQREPEILSIVPLRRDQRPLSGCAVESFRSAGEQAPDLASRFSGLRARKTEIPANHYFAILVCKEGTMGASVVVGSQTSSVLVSGEIPLAHSSFGPGRAPRLRIYFRGNRTVGPGRRYWLKLAGSTWLGDEELIEFDGAGVARAVNPAEGNYLFAITDDRGWQCHGMMVVSRKLTPVEIRLKEPDGRLCESGSLE